MNVTLRLLRSELLLLLREPLVLAFVFAFPVVTVLILGGVFDDDDPAFEGVLPSDYYIAAYFAVVIAAVGLIMLPVHIASYREAGVLRRFDAAGFPRWAFPVSQLMIGAVFVAIGAVLLLATAALAYGLPEVENVARTIAGIVAGSLAFISIGVLLGTALPNARAAQGVGLLLFLPMFLLAGGGPPPDAMSSVMNDIATALPLTHVVRAIQEPWLGLGTGSDHLIVVIAIFIVATMTTLARSGSFRATPRAANSWRPARPGCCALRRADCVSTIREEPMLAEPSSHPQRQHRDVLDAARAGDAVAFRVLVEPHRAEIYSHCSRMFDSVHEADDAFQDAMLRAWRGLSGLLDGTRFRPWLYAIATNACIDAINARQKRARPIDCSTSTRSSDGCEAVDHSIWVETHANPSPGGAGGNLTPEGCYERRESLELAFLAALQHLPGRQRAVLILREVLGFSAREVAQLLQTTVPSVNSTLQRARRSVHERVAAPSGRVTMRAHGDKRVRGLVARFIDALEAGDVDTILAILTPAPPEARSAPAFGFRRAAD